MKVLSIFGVVMLLVLVIAAFTNPDEKAHKKAFKVELKKIMDETIAKQKNEALGGAMLGFFEDEILDKAADKLVHRANYFVFSLTEIDVEDQSRIVGGGAFTYVYISPEMKKRIEKVIDSLQ